MPSFEDIFSDGPEHLKRMLRLRSLNKKLQNEHKNLDRLLLEIGERGWRVANRTCRQLPTAKMLLANEKEITLLNDELSKAIEILQEKYDQQAGDLTASEKEAGDIGEGLMELTAQKNSLLSEISELEAELKTVEVHRDKLKEDMEAINSDLVDEPEDKEAKPAPEDIEEQIKSANSSMRSMRMKLSNRRKKLDKLELDITEAQSQVNRLRISHQRYIATSELMEKERKELVEDAERRIKSIERSNISHYRQLGHELLKERPSKKELDSIFSRYDLLYTTVDTIRNNIESETTLQNLLDRNAVIWFYTIASLSTCLIVAVCISIIIGLSG